MPYEKPNNEENDRQMRERWLAELRNLPGEVRVVAKMFEASDVEGDSPAVDQEMSVAELIVQLENEQRELVEWTKWQADYEKERARCEDTIKTYEEEGSAFSDEYESYVDAKEERKRLIEEKENRAKSALRLKVANWLVKE